jgi:hypothetical protein
MGMFTNVRGWIELDHSQRTAAEDVIQQALDDHYSGGWSLPAKPFNWTLFLFYGGEIRESALPWFRDQLDRLAGLPPVDDDGDQPRGLFVVTDERGQAERWEIRNGVVSVLSAPEFRWLAD